MQIAEKKFSAFLSDLVATLEFSKLMFFRILSV